MKENEMEKIGLWIAGALKNHDNETVLSGIKKEVEELCLKFPVPGLPIAE